MIKNTHDTVLYLLRDDQKIVYIGTTSNLDISEKEHIRNGENFTRIAKLSVRMPVEWAKQKQTKLLSTYCGCHEGKFPKYNECAEI